MPSDFWNNSTLLTDAYLVVFGDIYVSSTFITIGNPASGQLYNSESFFDSLNPYQYYFGYLFNQDSNNIYIKKSELPGLTVINNNSAQSLLVALINRLIPLYGDDNVYKILASVWGGYVYKGKKNLTLEIKIYDSVSLDENQSIQYPDTNIDPNKY